MASRLADRIPVTCPHCGHVQSEPRTAYSSLCKKCRQHFRLEEALHPVAKPTAPVIEQRTLKCFQCGTELHAPKAASSTMCKRCSSHVDLTDYQVTQTVSKNFRTHGRLVIEEKGYLLNTESRVADAVVKGRLIGKLIADNTLELHSTANIKGQFSAGRLLLPATEQFTWPEPLRVGSAEIAGALAADINASGTVTLTGTARFFGYVEAAALVVHPGAVFVGTAKVGPAYHAGNSDGAPELAAPRAPARPSLR